MSDEQSLEDRQAEDILASAEAEFNNALALLGIAREDMRKRLDAGAVPVTDDITAMMSDLNKAWYAAQKERDRVAEFRRRNGGAEGAELDLVAARVEVCERLDRIAAAKAAEGVPG